MITTTGPDTNSKSKCIKCFSVPQRYILGLMGFWALVNAYTMRVCLSIAITEMVLPVTKNDSSTNSSVFISSTDVCPVEEIDIKLLNHQFKHHNISDKYEWSESEQGIILSAFYWGYIITHIPGGVLAEKFGGKHLLGFGILSTAIFTLLTPTVVRYGNWYWLTALRVFQGFGEGTTFPALNVLLANWAPVSERAKLGTLVFSGSQIGTVAGNLIGGLLIENTNEWSSVFYFFGVTSIVWFLLWNLFCYSKPELDPFISERELEYLKNEIVIEKKNKRSIPWTKILTSVSVWALICAQIGHDWAFFTMVTDLPKYMKDVLKFSVGRNGFYSSVPFLFMWICSLVSAFLCDWLIAKQYLKITVARKLFTTIASLGPSVGILLASYSGCNKEAAVLFFILSMGLMGTFFPGMKVNALDLSTNFSGTLMALVNGIGAITGIFVPYIAGVLTPNHLLIEWRNVFWLSFAVNIITNIIFIMFGSGKEQPWNKISTNNIELH